MWAAHWHIAACEHSLRGKKEFPSIDEHCVTAVLAWSVPSVFCARLCSLHTLVFCLVLLLLLNVPTPTSIKSSCAFHPAVTQAVVGDGNVGIGQLMMLSKQETAARRTVLWVTQGTHIVGGKDSLWDKKELLNGKPDVVIAVPAKRILKL